MELDETVADDYQEMLKENIPSFKNQAGAYLFIWDCLQYYDDPGNITMHTIIATPYCLTTMKNQQISVAEWLMNAVNGKLNDQGL